MQWCTPGLAQSEQCCGVLLRALRPLFVQVDLRRCVKVDQRQFLNDHFDLSGNACVSLHDNFLALTSVSDTHLSWVGRVPLVTQLGRRSARAQCTVSVGMHASAYTTTPWRSRR